MNLRTERIGQVFSHFSYPAIKGQMLKIWPSIGLGVIISLAGAAITVLVAGLTHNPIWKLAKDPAEVMQYPAYIGMLSNWGVLLWISAAAICLFGAAVLKEHRAARATVMFIVFSGILSVILGVDDLFRLHDNLLPKLFHAKERIFYLLYLLVLLAYLIYFFPKIMEYDYLLLSAAFFLFAISRRAFVTIPYFDRFMTTGDMLKYFGIVFWLVFFCRTTRQEVSALWKTSRDSSI
jgi:hypothetical protein